MPSLITTLRRPVFAVALDLYVGAVLRGRAMDETLALFRWKLPDEWGLAGNPVPQAAAGDSFFYRRSKRKMTMTVTAYFQHNTTFVITTSDYTLAAGTADTATDTVPANHDLIKTSVKFPGIGV